MPMPDKVGDRSEEFLFSEPTRPYWYGLGSSSDSMSTDLRVLELRIVMGGSDGV